MLGSSKEATSAKGTCSEFTAPSWDGAALWTSDGPCVDTWSWVRIWACFHVSLRWSLQMCSRLDVWLSLDVSWHLDVRWDRVRYSLTGDFLRYHVLCEDLCDVWRLRLIHGYNGVTDRDVDHFIVLGNSGHVHTCRRIHLFPLTSTVMTSFLMQLCI